MLIFIFVKALLVHLIDSKTTCSSQNGENINLFSCRGCTVVIGCALHKPSTDPVWSCNGEPMSKDSDRIQIAEENKFNLQRSELVKSDKGKYCCVAISRNVSEYYCASLEVIELQILPNDKIIYGSNGSTVTLTCSIENNIPGAKKISWIKNDQLVSSNTSNILTVTFLLTKEVNKQNLKFKAELDCIDTPLEQNVKFSVTYPPSVKVAVSPSSELNEKDNMSLTCTHESNPHASITTWTKNGIPISHETEYQKINISREDNGLYVCNVSNTIGYDVDKVQISVYFAPEVSVEQLTNGSLFCNATGVPNIYTFSKWEHRSIDGYYLRTLESKVATLLTFDTKHDKPIYTIDGRYQCNVSNGVPDKKNLTFQNGYKDVYFPGKPHCFPKNNEQIIRKRSDTVMIAFDVYSSNITRYEWWNGNCSLNQTFEYEFTTNQSTTSVLIYGTLISLNTTTIALKISNLTEAHFETQYSLFIYNEQGNSNCSMTLLEGRVPAKPTKFEVIPLKGSFQVIWLPGNSGHFLQSFIIKYCSLLAKNWTTVEHSSNAGRQTVQDLPENMNYSVYMFARNIIGKSDDTDTVTITTLQTITMSTRQFYSVTLSAYIAACFCCVVILLLASVFYIRLREFAFKGQKKTKIDISKQREYCQQTHLSVYEEVILNPAQNGKRFIINTIAVDDDLNMSG